MKQKKVERITTGVPGLDELLDGGFVKGSIVLLSGDAGTGKTIFSTQFLWKNIAKGMKGVYITLQQLPEDILDDIEYIQKDMRSAIDKRQLKIVYVDLQRIRKLVEIIVEHIDASKASLLVVDSITLFCESTDKVIEIRYSMTKLMKELKKRGVTTILVSEVPDERSSRFGVEEFIADGVILLRAGYDVIGASPRSLIIKKMRRTSHDMEIHPVKIDEHGFKILSIKFDKTVTDKK